MSDNIIIHSFTCDPTLIGMDAINATNRKKYVTDSVVKTMPRGAASSGQIHFFKVGTTLEVGQPAQEAAKRGLRLADPHTLAAFNAANPKFADTHPNGTEWDDASGIACYATFDRWNDERNVSVEQSDSGWADDWWFAAVSNGDLELNS